MSWVQTASGLKISFENPDPEQISILDIAFSLSSQPRYNGHGCDHYSVAEHCCHLFDWISDEVHNHDMDEHEKHMIRLQALLHDAPEYVTGDIVGPLKEMLGPVFTNIENRIWNAVCKRFGVWPEIHPLVRHGDASILFDEKDQLFEDSLDWGFEAWRLGIEIQFWDRDQAFVNFIRRCDEIGLNTTPEANML